MGVPQARWMVYFVENPNLKMDDLKNRGYPHIHPLYIIAFPL